MVSNRNISAMGEKKMKKIKLKTCQMAGNRVKIKNMFNIREDSYK